MLNGQSERNFPSCTFDYLIAPPSTNRFLGVNDKQAKISIFLPIAIVKIPFSLTSADGRTETHP